MSTTPTTTSNASKVAEWVKTHPGTVAGAVIGTAAVALVIYWIVDNWPLIKALGTAAVLAASFGFLAYIIAGIVGIAAPALIASVKALKASLSSNKEEADAKNKAIDEDPSTTPEQKAAAKAQVEADKATADAKAVDSAKTLMSNTNRLSQAEESGLPGSVNVTFEDASSSSYDSADGVADGIGDDIAEHGPIASSGFEGSA